MWYFAYGSNLNSKAVSEWCRHFGHKPPNLKPGKPGVLDNYRLSFPIFSEYWGGGIADIVYDPGKYVMGVLFDLPEADLAVLDLKVARKQDGSGKDVGVYKRIDVSVSPLGKGEPVKALTYPDAVARLIRMEEELAADPAAAARAGHLQIVSRRGA